MSKLIFFKWVSLMLSLGFVAYFIASDIQNDNKVIPAHKEEIEIITEEDISEEVDQEAITEMTTIDCNTAINAYNAQITSDNDKISQSIIDKYNECMGTVLSEPEKEAKIEKVKINKGDK